MAKLELENISRVALDTAVRIYYVEKMEANYRYFDCYIG